MLQVAHPRHRLVPAGVGHEVERDEIEATQIGAGLAQSVANLAGFAEVADAAAHGVARLEQLERDMAAQEAGNSGEQDGVNHTILHSN